MYRVLIAILLIVGVAALLAFVPWAPRYYRFEDAMPFAFAAACVAAVSLFFWLTARVFALRRRMHYIAICLTAAELEMNNLLFRGYDQSGRVKKMVERQEWAKLVPPNPMVLVNTEYKLPIEPMYAGYEKDMDGSKGDKRLINQTAVLLREVMNANIIGAKMRVEAEYRNTGKLPYVAAGIAELIGLDKFDQNTGRFPRGCGERRWLVRHVIRSRGFPAWLVLNDGNRAYKGMDVLNKLTGNDA